MNNTLSHPGLSYSHPSYAPHHPSHTHLMQPQGSSTAHMNNAEPHTNSSHVPYSSNNSPLQQQNMPPQTSTTYPTHSSHQQSMVTHPGTSHPNLSSPGLPLQPSRGPPTTNNSAVFPSSVCINPYMSIPMSPSSHPSYLPPTHHHSPYMHPHLHPHAFIAPPPGFNMHSTNNSQQPRQGLSLSSGVYGPSSNSSSSVTTETSKAASSYAANDVVGKLPYAGVVANAAGAMVPYAGTQASSQPQGYHSPSALPYPAYRYPPGYCPPPPTPHYPSAGVDSALFYKLHETHLSFLNTDDSPDKMELRKDVDDLLQRVVYVTPHEHKWRFAGVREVLEMSVAKQPHFDPFKAASAFEALASYASNLIVHPWRREYRNIKLYSGYWVHYVDEHLVHPEIILRLMGYLPQRSKAGDEALSSSVGCYQLPGPIIDVDVVSGLALDCLIAWCECQVIGRLQQQFPQLSPQQLLQYRQLSTGSYEQTAQNLLYFLRGHESAGSPAAVVDVGRDVADTGSGHRRHSQDGSLATSSRQSESSKQQLLSLLRPIDGHQLSSSPASPRQSDSSNNQLVRLVPKSYNLQQSVSSKSSLDSESWSPKKAALAINNIPHSSVGAADLNLVSRTSVSDQPPVPSRRSGGGNICSLPSTPTMTSTASILDRIQHLPESIPASLDQFAGNMSNKEKYLESRIIVPVTSGYGLDKYSSQIGVSGKHHSGDKSGSRHSGGIGGGDGSSYEKQLKASDRLQLHLMQEQLDHFIGDTSPDQKPSRSERFRDGGGGKRTEDTLLGGNNSSLVATAQLIDHEELRQSGNRDGGHATTHRHRESTSHLPKVLPQIRSSTFSSRTAIPADPPNACSLPSSIPRELFQDNTFEEHIKESYSLLNDSHKMDSTSRKSLIGSGNGGGGGQTYSDTWGFVMQDLEKKGYNKDVGNRGDILHHLSNSKSNTTSNIAGTTFTNSAPNAASGATVVVPVAVQFGLDSEVPPELIPSTLHSVKKERTDASSANTLNNNNNTANNDPGRLHQFPHELTLPDALEQLKINDAAAAARSRGSSTARNRSAGNGVGDDYYDMHHNNGKHKYYSSDESDRQRNSVYDNVSCEGFETARQDTDEEEGGDDGRNKRRAVAQPVSYSEACVNGVTGGSSNRGAGYHSSTLTKEGSTAPPVVVRGGVFYSSLSNCSSSNSSSNNSSKYINASDSNIPATGKASSNKSNTSNSKRLPPLSLLSNKLSSSTSTKDSNEHKTPKSSEHFSSGTSATAAGNSSNKPKSNVQKSCVTSSFAPWSCVSCTFLNDSNPSVCEVCSRSRQAPGTAAIKPLVTGGRQCNQCTLINDKDAITCSACNHTLEACPTYI